MSVKESSNEVLHEFHHKVLIEMRRDLDLTNANIARKLSIWIQEGRVENYHCGENMVYLLKTGEKNRPVIIEVMRNPIMDPIHNTNIRRYIGDGVGNYTHYEPVTF